jgi:hypothetical protein
MGTDMATVNGYWVCLTDLDFTWLLKDGHGEFLGWDFTTADWRDDKAGIRVAKEQVRSESELGPWILRRKPTGRRLYTSRFYIWMEDGKILHERVIRGAEPPAGYRRALEAALREARASKGGRSHR